MAPQGPVPRSATGDGAAGRHAEPPRADAPDAAAVAILSAGSGAVVNIGSSGGLGEAAYGSPEYGAAKAGIWRFTASLGSRTDVRVMAVVPGWIGLERAHREWDALTPDQQQDAGPLIPPQEVADVVATLLDHGRPGEIVELLHQAEQWSTTSRSQTSQLSAPPKPRSSLAGINADLLRVTGACCADERRRRGSPGELGLTDEIAPVAAAKTTWRSENSQSRGEIPPIGISPRSLPRVRLLGWNLHGGHLPAILRRC